MNLGSLFLILALALAGKAIPTFNYDLLVIIAIGLFATTKWHLRGCVYALFLLAISVACKHLWISGHHLCQAALEGSVGCSLLLCALAQKERALHLASLEQRIKTIPHLEDELEQSKEGLKKESCAWAEKKEHLQRQIEETEADLAALQVLNEVLRKTTAQAIGRQATCENELLQAQRKEELLVKETCAMQQELKRLGNESELAKQNGELFQELNAARFKEMQTHLVNETLVRLHAQESRRVKELEAGKQEAHLYRQLQHQFEEKNGVLQETRRELFRTSTELQTLKVQAEQKECVVDPLAKELYVDLETAERENHALVTENQCLQELVTHLMAEGAGAVKKKWPQPLVAEQQTLF